MKKQTYSNHRRYYIPHHFILLPLLCILIGVGISKACTDEIHSLNWWLFSITIFCILYLALMVRQHYALGNQNRIVRLEFRLRYFEIFNTSSKGVEQHLSFKQIAALRFADDIEFVELLNRAVQENLSGNDIKKAIRNWQPDNDRI
jgi:hypothetical protein